MTKEIILAALKDAIQESLGVDRPKDTDSFVNDLVMDSLDNVDVLFKIEKQFNIHISDEIADGFHSMTVEQMADAILRLMAVNESTESKITQELTKAFHEVLRGSGCNFVDYLENGFEFTTSEGKRMKVTISEIKKKQ